MDTDVDGKFGRYLLAKRLVSEATLHKARSFQQNNPVMRIGEILVHMQCLGFSDLMESLRGYRAQCKLGQLLIWDGVVTKAQLSEALEKQHEAGGLLGEILVSMGACRADAVQQALAEQSKKQPVS